MLEVLMKNLIEQSAEQSNEEPGRYLLEEIGTVLKKHGYTISRQNRSIRIDCVTLIGYIFDASDKLRLIMTGDNGSVLNQYYSKSDPALITTIVQEVLTLQ